ncbi:YcjX family protein [Vibrio agarivorans]|uniref:YcjX family protein n=1 Tax=Vibrio agarivorans TaxID=153622 RepID=UPI0025B5D7F4|nr:YcjX family protein [Vibrio agarivorans]MDN3663653.1 YcjX family protein [Vibrio agarivorans]
MRSITRDVSDLVNRSLDAHVRVAVTGLSTAGKTAFITSLVNQLLNSSTHDNLPLLSVAREGRLIGAKRVPQKNLLVPRFAYDEAMEQLSGETPAWPTPTRDVSEIRLAVKYRPKSKTRRLLSKTSTLHIDIVDYPGEWLLDLPLLEQDYFVWSESQLAALSGQRSVLAEGWLECIDQLDLDAPANEAKLQAISEAYTQYLLDCKDVGYHWVQPGRFVLPGDLKGAPVLQFFPIKKHDLDSVVKGSNLEMLLSRYKEYQTSVVKRFYKDYFSSFDRQIVLVDCLTPLNSGRESFQDMRFAIEQIMQSYRYGRSSLLSRLFAPKIDKVLFAATKADHVTPEQHPPLVSLLQKMVHKVWQQAAYEHIDMQCMSIASIEATNAGHVYADGKMQSVLKGATMQGDKITVFPGSVPKSLPDVRFWHENRFDFAAFRPQQLEDHQPLPHIRMDKVIDYVLGDKLR